MKNYLAIDFGASRIKATVLSVKANTGRYWFSQERTYPSLQNQSLIAGRFEVDPCGLHSIFIKIIHDNVNDHVKIHGILLACEMHGFLIANTKLEALTPYISWQDERGADSLDWINSFCEQSQFRIQTGLKIKPGLPVTNLFSMAKQKELPLGENYILSMGDWLSVAFQKTTYQSHVSLANSMGFTNVSSFEFLKELIDGLKACGHSQLRLFDRSSEVRSAGFFNNTIPIYTAIGDLIAAIHGVDSSREEKLFLNLGTGSQVAICTDTAQPDGHQELFEIRNYLDKKYLKVITHIPSGRMLNCYAKYYKEKFKNEDFWDKISQLTAQKILNQPAIEMNLALFPSAWNYVGTSELTCCPKTLDSQDYLASLIHHYAMQYKKALEILDPHHRVSFIQLSGGLVQRVPALREVIENLTHYFPVEHPGPLVSETLQGLARIALKLSLSSV